MNAAWLIAWLPLLVLVHELGHWCMARWLGYEVRLRLTRHGPGALVLAPGGSWSDRSTAPESAYPSWDLVRISLAGPVASLALGVGFMVAGFGVAGLMSVELGVVCLWPRGRSDGGRAWRAWRRSRTRSASVLD